MAIITLSAALVATLGVDGVQWGQRTYGTMSRSDVTGAQQDRPGGEPRWLLTLQPPEVFEERHGVLWEDLQLQLRGSVNHLAAWDPKRPAPRGTMRGTLTLNATAAAGATSLSITGGVGQANTTLLSGSPLQLGTGIGTSQLVRTVGNAQANGSGVITVAIEPPTRIQFASSTAVTWDKALAYFKRTTPDSRWTYHTGVAVRHGPIELLEHWTA